MQDRFKFRIWDKKTQRMRTVWALTPFGPVACDSTKTGMHREPFDNCVIMQCTGLKDKNGKLIFEGDILKTKEGLAKVEYYHAEFVLVLIQNPDYSFVDWDTTEQAVIGNIYMDSQKNKTYRAGKTL